MKGPVVIKGADQLTCSWLSLLMRMLSHPVVKRSQQLTDRMLRLLSQIARNILPPTAAPVKPQTANAGDEASTAGASGSAAAGQSAVTAEDSSGSNQ